MPIDDGSLGRFFSRIVPCVGFPRCMAVSPGKVFRFISGVPIVIPPFVDGTLNGRFAMFSAGTSTSYPDGVIIVTFASFGVVYPMSGFAEGFSPVLS